MNDDAVLTKVTAEISEWGNITKIKGQQKLSETSAVRYKHPLQSNYSRFNFDLPYLL